MATPGTLEPVPTPWQPGQRVKKTDTGYWDEDEHGQGEVPAEKPDTPKAPEFKGYEGLRFESFLEFAPPPVASSADNPAESRPPSALTDTAHLDEEKCRQALLDYVGEHCCYGGSCARDMKIRSVDGRTALHLSLETFGESRQTRAVQTPYTGGMLDGPDNGAAPGPWAVPCHPNKMFEDQRIVLEVPHTTAVNDCSDCKAKGFHICVTCDGNGRISCSKCQGSGVVSTEAAMKENAQSNAHAPRNTQTKPCRTCRGSGKESCWKCAGEGRVSCRTCRGYRQMRSSVELCVQFTNHSDDFILEMTDLPPELVREVGGNPVYQQVQPQVTPLTNYPSKEINDNSARLINSHKGQWPKERILNQRHTLRAVPVTEVSYEWKKFKSHYWIYGRENKVFAPDYPQQCCWGCNLL